MQTTVGPSERSFSDLWETSLVQEPRAEVRVQAMNPPPPPHSMALGGPCPPPHPQPQLLPVDGGNSLLGWNWALSLGEGLLGLTQAGRPEVKGQAGVGRSVSAPRSGERQAVGDPRVVGQAAWPGGCLTAPLLSAGEAFLGSFVASGMGPSASSHGSPVPLPSDLSFRSPTPSNLPMVQLWATHAHEGKGRVRWGGGRAGAAGLLSPALLALSHSLHFHGHPSPLWLSHVAGRPCCSSSCHCLRAFARGVSLLASPHPPHWLSPVQPFGAQLAPAPIAS